MLLPLKSDPQFAPFLESIQAKSACQGMVMDNLLQAPLTRVRRLHADWTNKSHDFRLTHAVGVRRMTQWCPLSLQISSYIQSLQNLRAHTHTDHVDYKPLHDVIAELEIILKVGASPGDIMLR